MNLVEVTDELMLGLRPLRFGPPVAYVYNPLEYARGPFDLYLKQYGSKGGARRLKRTILLGMNPGPWGMVQTGIPFGEVQAARDWLGVSAPVGTPIREHPKRPVLGFGCQRSEVSGERLWGWAKDKFGTADQFFERFFVVNHCPLAFLEESGRNRTPDKLPSSERGPLMDVCDRALRRTVEYLRPETVIGVGKFAEKRARIALEGMNIKIGSILHPSPASPLANKGWAVQATKQLKELGVVLPMGNVSR